MRGRDISLRPAPLDEFFFSGYGRPVFSFRFFLWGARYNIRLSSTWQMEFLFSNIILPPAVGGAIKDTPRQTAQTVPFYWQV